MLQSALAPRKVSVPLLYAIDQLAQRYSVEPWVFIPDEFDTPDETRTMWLQRGLIFMSMEASVKVTRGRPGEKPVVVHPQRPRITKRG